MDPIRQTLSEIGLTSQEASIYLFLITQESTPASTIADQLNITRSSSYDILKNLSEKGLVTSIEQNDSLKFSAEPPDNLLTILQNKEKKVIAQKIILEKIEEDIISKTRDKDNNLKVKHIPVEDFNEEYEKTYKNLDTKNQIIRSIGSGEEEDIDFVEQSISSRVKNKVKLHLLINKNEKTKDYKLNDIAQLRETIYFKKNKNITVDITIGPSRIDIEDSKSGYYTTIENKNIVKTISSIFDLCFNSQRI
jgi:sugar-specific transcriptional regulator TrmB